MRLSAVGVLVYLLAIASSISGAARDGDARRHGDIRDGQTIFRFDTFGDEQLWTDVLRMHEVIPTVDPTTALGVGLKVDVKALPRSLIRELRRNEVDLTDPAVTLELIRLNAVVGLKGSVEQGRLTKVGITCALCHSTVDDSFAPGIGTRLDGWANTDLNVGAILALSPALDDATKAEFRAWGPGKYDPRHHAFDGTNIIPLNTPSLPVVLPPVYGLKGVGFETFTGDGPISYWNSYVGVSQMGGHGTFNDARINLFINQTPDLVTPRLPALLAYQLSLRAPAPPARTIDHRSARRGRELFQNEAGCSTCHQGRHVHRRAERSQRHAAAARPGGGRHGPAVRGTFRDQVVPDDAPAGAVATSTVLSRRQRGRPARGRGALQPALPTPSDAEAEDRSGGVSEDALA